MLYRSPEQLSEIVAKSANDYWVVARRSEQREVYVVLHKKDATLLDVQGAWSTCSGIWRSRPRG